MITKLKLYEYCDKMTLPNGDELSHEDKDSIPFLYYNDNLYVGYFGETHGSQSERIADYEREINNDDEITDDEIWDNIFDHGRIWIKHKIISWWNIPDKPTFKKIINDLERKMGIKIWNNNYYLELIKDENINKNEYNKYPGEEYSKSITNASKTLSYWKFIPIEEYTNENKLKKSLAYRQILYSESTFYNEILSQPLFHGCDYKHDFEKFEEEVKKYGFKSGTFFSTQKSFVDKGEYGFMNYEIYLKPTINLFDSTNIDDAKILFKRFKTLVGYDKRGFYGNANLTSPYELIDEPNNWVSIEKTNGVLNWIKDKYDGVIITENFIKNVLIFNPVKEKIQSFKLIR